MTSINDLVLIHMEDSPLAFARVEAIEPDIKPGWYHITLLMLQIPLQVVTWILRDAYIDGATFTMGGKEMRMEKVVCPKEAWPLKEAPSNESGSKPPAGIAKVISLADLKKK
jgi:hypothetical protein